MKNVSGKIVLLALLGVVSVSLIGCSSDNMDDIRAYAKKIKGRPAKSIEPLPEVRQHAIVEYAVANLPSPFVPPDPSKNLDRMKGLGIRPDFNRPKEPLEAFPMDSLRMVGVLEINDELWAVISDPEGIIYKVQKGNYIGTNFGKISHISESGVEVSEIIPDNRNGWRRRLSSLVLGE